MGDSIVLVHLPTNRIFELNETGARIWELIRDGVDETHLTDRLTEEFEIDEARAGAEVADLIDRLRREGLLQP